jgi:prepilin-type processing-associated H-X9-DG protein
MQTCRSQRYTLVEILLVIGLILILAALLMPVLENSQERAMTVVCMSNMKQMGMGLIVYDKDNKALASCWKWLDAQAGTLWADDPNGYDRITKGQVFPYVMEKEMFVCPAGSDKFRDKTGRIPTHTYSQNEMFGNSWNGIRVRRLTQVTQPDERLMVAEENVWVQPPWSNYMINNACLGVGFYQQGGRDDPTLQINPPAGTYNTRGIIDGIGTWHGTRWGSGYSAGLGMVLFVDGHVNLSHPRWAVSMAYPPEKMEKIDNTGTP